MLFLFRSDSIRSESGCVKIAQDESQHLLYVHHVVETHVGDDAADRGLSVKIPDLESLPEVAENITQHPKGRRRDHNQALFASTCTTKVEHNKTWESDQIKLEQPTSLTGT